MAELVATEAIPGKEARAVRGCLTVPLVGLEVPASQARTTQCQAYPVRPVH